MEHKFGGYDWTELIECWGIDNIGRADDLKGLAYNLRVYMIDRIDYGTGKFKDEYKYMRTDINNFLQALHDHQSSRDDLRRFSYWHPVYKAMIEIEDDEALVWMMEKVFFSGV